MDKFELQDFNKRIGLNTDLENISREICKAYDLGDYVKQIDFLYTQLLI